MKHAVYIPSKKRAATCTTPYKLAYEGIDFRLVLEPQDVAEYQRHSVPGSFVVLPENDLGNGYVRNFIQNHAETPFAWFLDDDLTTCVELQEPTALESHLKPSTFRIAMEKMEAELESFEHTEIFIAGPAYIQAGRAWNPEPHKWNRNIGTFYMASTSMRWNRYDPTWKVRADAKFLLSNLVDQRGLSLIFQHHLFRCAALGGNPGGCKEYYDQDLTAGYIRQLVDLYPEYCKLRVTDTGDSMLRFNWRKIDELFV